MAHGSHFKIYAKFENGSTFFLGETYAEDGQEITAKKKMAAQSGQTLTDFFNDIKNVYSVKSLSAVKEPCLCTECTK